jgi:hypothetical protein
MGAMRKAIFSSSQQGLAPFIDEETPLTVETLAGVYCEVKKTKHKSLFWHILMQPDRYYLRWVLPSWSRPSS